MRPLRLAFLLLFLHVSPVYADLSKFGICQGLNIELTDPQLIDLGLEAGLKRFQLEGILVDPELKARFIQLAAVYGESEQLGNRFYNLLPIGLANPKYSRMEPGLEATVQSVLSNRYIVIDERLMPARRELVHHAGQDAKVALSPSFAESLASYLSTLGAFNPYIKSTEVAGPFRRYLEFWKKLSKDEQKQVLKATAPRDTTRSQKRNPGQIPDESGALMLAIGFKYFMMIEKVTHWSLRFKSIQDVKYAYSQVLFAIPSLKVRDILVNAVEYALIDNELIKKIHSLDPRKEFTQYLRQEMRDLGASITEEIIVAEVVSAPHSLRTITNEPNSPQDAMSSVADTALYEAAIIDAEEQKPSLIPPSPRKVVKGGRIRAKSEATDVEIKSPPPALPPVPFDPDTLTQEEKLQMLERNALSAKVAKDLIFWFSNQADEVSQDQLLKVIFALENKTPFGQINRLQPVRHNGLWEVVLNTGYRVFIGAKLGHNKILSVDYVKAGTSDRMQSRAMDKAFADYKNYLKNIEKNSREK